MGEMMSDELLRVENLHVSVEGTSILNGLNLTINRGEIHAIMGRNGAGKSTLASVIMGHPAYEITKGTIHYKGSNIEDMEVFERARDGMFLSFQYPAAIPGVQVGTFLRKSVASVRGEAPPPREFRKELKDAMENLSMDRSFLSRYVNQGFSGGEKKRLEILQLLLLQPDLALLDETDSGLDIDSLKTVAEGVNSQRNDHNSFLIITHYQRLLNHIEPDFVHVFSDGRIVQSGDKSLALKLESEGYDWVQELTA